ncbi:NAD-dependent epimerase/dehydratase family protein [Clostridium butyricum]|uniref:NAD-dependent epimerase/dehydratase family protein n=1 Tax=Clostridium butyricum TaxID=1492 RepID=UPI002106428F|nr:SDR family oxidoreductase [Clostridium butyricum]MCQ2014183.1 SDR family oxidoreductase [Clostridium butyricum]MCQ2026273.1 SDR family oxidoreductase [Clostridium butyricum]
MSKILLTGGNGYLGRYIYRYLKESGHEVIITSRKKERGVRYLNLLEEKSINGVCKDIDIVIHTATMDEKIIKGNEKDAYLINSYGTRNLYLDAISNGVKKFIYFSTFHVYGKSIGIIDENTEINSKSDYGLSHYFAEKFIRQFSDESNCESVILRLTNGIGVPIDNDKWYLVVNDFCKTIYETGQLIIKSNGLVYRDFVDIEDVVYAVDNFIKSDVDRTYQVYNISSQKSYSIKDVAEIIKSIYEKRYSKVGNIVIKEATNYEIENFKKTKLLVNSEKLRKRGWESKISLEDTVNKIFYYLEKNKRKIRM